MGESVLDLADELYALGQAEFTPARDALAREHKGQGDLPARIKALRKPTLAAWVVNLLVRREPDQVDQLLEVGAALREAQAQLDAAQLREFTKQRRQLTSAVTTAARRTAREEGVRVTESVATQVEATLTAAMLDAEAARAVRSGLLVQPLASTGVDPVEVAAALALPEALGHSASPAQPVVPTRPDLHVVPDPDAADKARREAREALAAAEVNLEVAQGEQDAATADVDRLQARTLELQARADEIRRGLAVVEDELDEVDADLEDAEDSLGVATAGLEQARSEADRARQALERLGD